MKYWDWVVRFFEKMAKEYPSGQQGLSAVLFLRSFFEGIGCEGLSRSHPLHNRLSIGMEPNYLWLAQYARKLITASSLSGFEQVATRFADPREYLSANNETEVAIRLHVAGMGVSFSKNSSQPTPDLIMKIDNETFRVEVTSLNPPDEEMRVQMLVDHISTVGFLKDIATGGFVSRVPSLSKLKEAANRVNEAIDRVNASRKVEKLSIEGIATVYLTPNDLADQLPEDSRRTFRLNLPYRRRIEELIMKKVEGKNKQLGAYDEPGVLFLFTKMIDRQEVSQLFERNIDDVEVMLASYPKLLGLFLTVPHLGIHVASAVKSDDLKKEYKKNKAFLESEVGVYQYESSLVWKNLHADHRFPEKVLQAFENYPANLSKLEPLDESFQGFRSGS